MIDIQIKSESDGDSEAQALAELIASTLHGHIAPDPQSDLAAVGKLVRDELERAEQRRPSRQQIETVDFAKIDDDLDWSDV
jgi:hypothetical protein